MRKILLICALISWAYAAAVAWSDYQHRLKFPAETREVLSQPGPVRIGATDIRIIEAPGLSDDDFVQGQLTLSIGDQYFTAAEEAWIDTRANPTHYAERYLERFDMGYLRGATSRRLYIVETLQGEYALADEPRLNLWSIDEQGHIESLQVVTSTQARQEPAWRAVFATAHAAAPRALPALAALIFGLGVCLPVLGRWWRQGGWGVVCALTHFLVPVIGGAPLLAAPGRPYLAPAIVLAFLLTATAGAAFARWWRSRRISNGFVRVASAAIVPLMTLLTGVAAAVILAAVFASLGKELAALHVDAQLVQPGLLLLRTGVGVALLLMLAGGMYDFFMARRIRQAQRRLV